MRPSVVCYTADLLLSCSRVSEKVALKHLLTLLNITQFNCFFCSRNKELYLLVEEQKGRERKREVWSITIERAGHMFWPRALPSAHFYLTKQATTVCVYASRYVCVALHIHTYNVKKMHSSSTRAPPNGTGPLEEISQCLQGKYKAELWRIFMIGQASMFCSQWSTDRQIKAHLNKVYKVEEVQWTATKDHFFFLLWIVRGPSLFKEFSVRETLCSTSKSSRVST